MDKKTELIWSWGICQRLEFPPAKTIKAFLPGHSPPTTVFPWQVVPKQMFLGERLPRVGEQDMNPFLFLFLPVSFNEDPCPMPAFLMYQNETSARSAILPQPFHYPLWTAKNSASTHRPLGSSKCQDLAYHAACYVGKERLKALSIWNSAKCIEVFGWAGMARGNHQVTRVGSWPLSPNPRQGTWRGLMANISQAILGYTVMWPRSSQCVKGTGNQIRKSTGCLYLWLIG